MAWKYVNPGYAELLENTDSTTVEDTTINPINRVAFSNPSGSENITIPEGIKEFWVKCRFVRSNNVGKIYFQNSAGEDITGVMLNYSDKVQLYQYWGKYTTFYIDLSSLKEINICIHFRLSNSNGLIELYINGNIVGSVSGDIGSAAKVYKLKFDTGNSTSYFSNLIIADYDIRKEEIAIAELTDLTGTWDGIETGTVKATEVGQVLSQKIDTADLKAQIKAQSAVISITGITVAGLNMEYDNSKVNGMTGIINGEGENVFSETKEINSFNSMVCSSYKKDMDIDDISKITCSLKAAKV